MSISKLAAVAIATAFLALPVCGTPIDVSLASPLQSGLPGTTLGFSGMLTNTTGSTLFLNADSISVAPPIAIDDAPFFFNFPVSLIAGGSASGLIVNAAIPLGTLPGDYLGSFSVLGGSTQNSLDNLGSALFTVRVAAPTDGSVPDSGTTILLFGTSLVGLLLVRRSVKA